MNIREYRNLLGFSSIKRDSEWQKMKEFATYDGITPSEVRKRIDESICIEGEWIEARDNDGMKSVNPYYKSKHVKYQDWEWYYKNSVGDYIWTLNELTEVEFDGRILDFGGGNGDFSIASSKIGYDIEYANLPGEQFDFVKWRFGLRKLDIKMLSAGKDYGSYDCFCAFEVAEHFKSPENYIKFILHVLNVNGYLIETTSFTQESHGHFKEYRFGNEIVDRRRATRYYRNVLRENFELIKNGWNSRPIMWRRVV